MKIFKESILVGFALIVASVLVFPTDMIGQSKTIKIKLIKRAKVNSNIYKTLSSHQKASRVQMLGNNSIAPKKGNLLFGVVGSRALINIATDDKPSSWSGETEIEIDENLFRLFFKDGGYLWSQCDCPNINDACNLQTTEGPGDGLEWRCDGHDCCVQKWGYLDAEGGGTIFE